MRFLAEWNSTGASINPLLELLRTHLREELNLEKNVPGIKIFRFEDRHPNLAVKRDGTKARQHLP
jgi:hypothetical protein